MQLAHLLQSRETDAAVSMLSTEPSLAWIRDDDSGGYPLHIAVWHVRTHVVIKNVQSLAPCMPATYVHIHTV